jgi:hypothetical protein
VAAGIPASPLASGWHPALTERRQRRHQRLAATIPGLETVLAVARPLIHSQRARDVPPQEIADRPGFPSPSSPHPLDSLRNHLP